MPAARFATRTDDTQRLARVRTPHKLGRPLLLPSYRAGEWDSHSVDTPFLFHHEGRFRMVHNAFDGIGYRSGLASSDDLITWDREGLITDRDPTDLRFAFNAHITSVLRDPDLFGSSEALRVDGDLIATWQAYPEPGQEQGRGCIGIARATDLRSWRFGPTVLRPEDGAAWERGGLYKPCLVRHDGRFFLFYNAKEVLDWPWREQIGVAWSDDLVHWTRHPLNPVVPNGPDGSVDAIFTADPCVLRLEDGTWAMFYYGLGSDLVARELVAFSDDLLTWRKGDEVLVDVGPTGSLDDQYAHKPGVIAKDGVVYHFYAASRRKTAADHDEVNAKDRRCITVATSVALA